MKTLVQQEGFANSESLQNAFKWVTGGIDKVHDRFLHYTNILRVIQKIVTKRWWLTRSDLDWLNDTQEAKKYGKPELLSRTYQASFSYGSSENAAMWGLYCPGDPFGVMISVSAEAMNGWFQEIRSKTVKACLEYQKATRKHGAHIELQKRQIEYADARDIIYAATNFAKGCSQCKKRDKKRRDTLLWFDSHTEKIDGLSQEINDGLYTGWLKDYEWRQENESRILIRVKDIEGKLPDNLSITIPPTVLTSMRFTLSPWLKDAYYDEIAQILITVVKELYSEKPPKNIVSRSTIAGALESWRKRYRGETEEALQVKKMIHKYRSGE